MSQKRVIFCALFLAIAAGYYYQSRQEADTLDKQDNVTNQPLYQSGHTVSKLYDINGQIKYQLTADKIDYYPDQEETFFVHPEMTLFNNTQQAVWKIDANHAKLAEKEWLYLTGDVLVNSLDSESRLKKVIGEEVAINLDTHDITSNNQIQLQGDDFRSSGRRMKGNLLEKTASLFDHVQTFYGAE